jgi:hypothetical protein
MASLLDEVGRELYAAFGRMMPKPTAWRASQKLARAVDNLAAIAAEIAEDTQDFGGMNHVASAVERLLEAATQPHARNAKQHATSAAEMAVKARELSKELTELTERLQQIATGRDSDDGASLPGLMHGYMVTRVKAVNAAAGYLDAIGATNWAQSLRNIAK